jgi:hypothetical protein
VREQEVYRAAQIFFRLLDVERHHQLARFVRRLGRAPVIEIGRERDEARGGKAFGHAFDVRHESPPFLYHDDACALLARLRQGQKPLRLAAVACEFHHLVRHESAPVCPDCFDYSWVMYSVAV